MPAYCEEPMDRALMRDSVLLWLRSHHRERWNELVYGLRGKTRERLDVLNGIADVAIARAEQEFFHMLELIAGTTRTIYTDYLDGFDASNNVNKLDQLVSDLASISPAHLDK